MLWAKAASRLGISYPAVPGSGSLSPFSPLPLLHSLVFWFGDLNFRIESLDICFVKYAIDSNVLSQLWEKDQVREGHAVNQQWTSSSD